MGKIFAVLKELYWKLRWSSRATAMLHVLAMNAPFNAWRLFFHKLRGVRMGKDVYIVQTAFLEEARPWLITIEDNVRIGSGVTINTHNAVFCLYINGMPNIYAPVVLRRNCTVGCKATIMEGVTVGEGAVVGAGALVVNDVPPGMVVVGVPAKVLCSVEEAGRGKAEKIAVYKEQERKTRYPWECRRPSRIIQPGRNRKR